MGPFLFVGHLREIAYTRDMSTKEPLKARLAAAQAAYASQLTILEARLDDALGTPSAVETEKYERLKALYDDLVERYALLNQTHGVECPKCGWAMRFPDQPCRCELVEEREDLIKLLRMLWADVIFGKTEVAEPTRAAILEVLRRR